MRFIRHVNKPIFYDIDSITMIEYPDMAEDDHWNIHIRCNRNFSITEKFTSVGCRKARLIFLLARLPITDSSESLEPKDCWEKAKKNIEDITYGADI